MIYIHGTHKIDFKDQKNINIDMKKFLRVIYIKFNIQNL